MRNVFFILLFANLAFLAWATWIDVPQPAPPNEAIERLPRLKLVSEQHPSGAARPMPTKRKTSIDGGLAAVNDRAAPRTQCLSIGPFPDITNTARAAALLREKGFDLRQRATEGEILEGYWVYIGDLKSDSDTSRVLTDLARNGIKDAHVMPETAEGRRVSVGLFSDPERANRRAQAVRNLGLDAQITERKLPGTVYWVEVTLRAGSDSALPTRDLVSEVPRSRIEVQPCPAEPGPTDPLAPPDRGPSGTFPATTVAGTPRLP